MRKPNATPQLPKSSHAKSSLRMIVTPPLFMLLILSIGYPAFSQAKTKQNAPDPKAEALALFEKAAKALEEENYQQAKLLFEQLIFSSPQTTKTPHCYLHLGQLYQKEGLTYEAKGIYTDFLSHYQDHPLRPEIYSRLGQINFQLGDIKKATLIFKHLVLKYPNTPQGAEANFHLADCLFDQDSGSAHLYYDEGMKTLPQYPSSHPITAFNIGRLYLEDNRLTEALEMFTAIEKNFPLLDFADKALTFCGDIYQELGNLTEALKAYQRVIDHYPKSIGAQVSTVRMADLGVEFKGASISDPNNSFQAFHKPTTAYRNLIDEADTDQALVLLAEYKLGLAFQKEHKHSEAIDTFRSVLAKNPEKSMAHNLYLALKEELVNLLQTYFAHQDYLSVIKLYERNKQLLDPYLQETKDPYPWQAVAKSYQSLEFFPQSLALYKKIKAIDPPLCPGHSICEVIQLDRAAIFFSLHQYPAALQALSNLDHSSNRILASQAVWLKGDIYAEQGNWAKAIPHYQQALSIESASAKEKLLFTIGRAYQQMNNFDQAIIFFNEALTSALEGQGPPDLKGKYLHLADCHYYLKEYGGALSFYEKLQEFPLDPQEKDWVTFQQGNCAQKENKLQSASQAYEQLKKDHQDVIWSIIADYKKAGISDNK